VPLVAGRRKFFLLFLVLVVVAIFHIQGKFSESFTPREPRIIGNDSGVVYYNPKKSFAGLNVLSSYVGDGNCEVFRSDGKEILTLPGEFCLFIPGQGYATFVHKQIRFFDSAFNQLWGHEARDFHHALVFDPIQKELFYLGEERGPSEEGVDIISDTIVGLNLKGEVIFSWNFLDHQGDLFKTTAPEAMLFRDKNYSDLVFQTLHLNSIDVLKKDQLQMGPAFKKGNLLVTSLLTHALFIVDRSSKEITWQFKEERYFRGVHSAQFMEDGRIVYFHNGDLGSEAPYSEIRVLNPKTKRFDWVYKSQFPHRFSAWHFGHVQALANGNFLVTDNPKGEGHAFEITPDKEIVWEWVNSRRNSQGRRNETYQVLRFPATDLVDFLPKPKPPSPPPLPPPSAQPPPEPVAPAPEPVSPPPAPASPSLPVDEPGFTEDIENLDEL
jgi:hypothetical protein